MNRKSLTILFSVAAVLVLIVVIVGGRRDGGPDKDLLLPGLEMQLNDITGIRVTAAGDTVVATLSRDEGRWRVAEQSGYPADLRRIRNNLLALAQARIVEQKTANPEYYARLGLADLEDESAAGIGLQLEGPAEPIDVIIGNTGVSGGDYTYVRLAGDPQSWMVSSSFDVSPDTLDWLDRKVLDIPVNRIQSVKIAHADGETLTIQKATPDEADYLLENMAEGRELQYAGVTNSIAGVLAALTFEDVQAITSSAPENVPTATAHFETFDGLDITVETRSLDDVTWIRFTVTADENAQTATTEAEQLNAALGGWTYTIASFKSEQLLKRLDDLLIAEEEPDPFVN